MNKKKYLIGLLLGIGVCVSAQTYPSLESMSDGIHHWNLEHSKRMYVRYNPDQYEQIADNLVAYQNTDGGWPKNIDWLAVLPADSVVGTLSERHRQSTLDNRNTYPQIDYLAQVYTLTGKSVYKDAITKGLNYLLRTQKMNGGWRGWDVDAITFNDEVTTGVLELFLRINEGDLNYAWLDDVMRHRINEAFNCGINMILRTQYVQNGVKTVWGQQHDNKTFLPTKARSYELPSLTAGESCDILRLLMSIPNPSDQIVESVKAAVTWLEKVAIYGIRLEKVSIPENQIANPEYPYNLIVVEDKTAPRIWARFYELKDNKPFMCNRDGVKVYRLEDVALERRVGYAWYVNAPETILKQYMSWLQKVKTERSSK